MVNYTMTSKSQHRFTVELWLRLIYNVISRGPLRGKMEAGIGLFLGWESGIGVTGTGIWLLGMGNEVLKNGNGIKIMPVDF